MSEREDEASPGDAPVDERTGRILDGRYRIGARLGHGGVGAVYRGTQMALGLSVAIKLLHEDAHPSFTQRFEREAKALATLRHPGIVSVTDYGVSEGVPYLVMELLEGETLAHRLLRGRIAPEQVMGLARELLRALDFVHAAGLVHRDLKPGNIFLERLPDGEERLKLLDFGLAKYVQQPRAAPDEAPITHTGHIVGTPAYIAPEQIGGDAVDARTDIYALGVVLYQMLCGRVPFEGEPVEQLKGHLVGRVSSLSEADPDITPRPEIDALLARAMAKDKDARFQSCSELLEALEAIPQPWLTDEHARRTEAVVNANTVLRANDSEAPTVARDSTPDAPGPPKPRPGLSEAPTTHRERRSFGIAVILGALGASVLLAAWLLATRGAAPPKPPPAATPAATQPSPPPQPVEAQPTATMPAVADAAIDASTESQSADAATDAEAPLPDAALQPTALGRAAASNPWARGVPPQLRSVRKLVSAGKHGSERTIKLLRAYNRAHGQDARGHLLLARLYDNRGWYDDAITQLEFAMRRDIAARGAPEVLAILLRRFAEGSAHTAGRLVVQVYGSEALPAIDRALAKAGVRPNARTRLQSLRSAALNAEYVWK